MVELKKHYRSGAEILLVVALMVSLGVDLPDGEIPYDQGYLSYTCDLITVPDMMCYKLSRVGDTTGVNRNCYYDRDRGKKYKVCSTGWKKVINLDDCPAVPDCSKTECPTVDDNCSVLDCSTCPKKIQYVTKYIEKECVQTCNGCGSGGGGSNTCPDCPTQSECKATRCIAFTDNGKYACNGCGLDAPCVYEGDLSQSQLDELGW